MKALWLMLVLSSLVGVSHAAIETLKFETPQQEETYRLLVQELRCLVCQNQNLADSDAELAQDLRKQVYTMVTEKGASKDDVVDYMVARYGDFVLYRPPLKSNTLMLWLGPAVLLLVGVFVAVRFIRGIAGERESDDQQVDLSEVKKILDFKDKSE